MTALASGARVSAVSAPKGLVGSEYCYLLAAVVAAVVIVDPLWNLRSDPVTKHLALMISVPAVLLSLLGRKLSLTPAMTKPVAEPLRAAWPLFLLAVFVVGGSLYARLVEGIQNTFLNVGLYMLMSFSAAAMVLQTHAPEALLRAYFRILLGAAAVMGVYLILYFRARQVYHEPIFLVIPMAALFYVRPSRSLARWAGTAFFLSMAWLSQKYTSFLTGVMTVVYLAFIVALPRFGSRSTLSRLTAAYWFVVALILTLVAFLVLARRGSVNLPTGNVEYRMHTYGSAWERFTDSPLWGTGFATESVEKFTLYTIGIAKNVLPTHSDVLDLLANGGIIAILLLVLGLLRVGRIAGRRLLRPGLLDHPWAPYGHTLALMSLAAVITYAFNPILLQPSMAYILWTNLGMLLGLSLRNHDMRSARSASDRGWGAGLRSGGP